MSTNTALTENRSYTAETSSNSNSKLYSIVQLSVSAYHESLNLLIDLKDLGIEDSLKFKFLKAGSLGLAGCIVDIGLSAEEEGLFKATVTGIGTFVGTVMFSVGLETLVSAGIVIGSVTLPAAATTALVGIATIGFGYMLGKLADGSYDYITQGRWLENLFESRDIDMIPNQINDLSNKYNGFRGLFRKAEIDPCQIPHDPIIIDLNNDGVLETTSL